jgi:hypothetical protein
VYLGKQAGRNKIPCEMYLSDLRKKKKRIEKLGDCIEK